MTTNHQMLTDYQNGMRDYVLTTDHPASSNGLPTLVEVKTGKAYGPMDTLPSGRIAHDFVSVFWYDRTDDPIALYLSQLA